MSFLNPQIPTIGEVLDDTSPQLGGGLDVNSNGIYGATGSGAGTGGNVLMYAGQGGPTGNGGYFYITAGGGGSSGNGIGGTCYVYGGTGRGTGAGGQVLIKSGTNNNTGVGGTLNILAGDGGGGGGPVNITGGAVTSTQEPYAGAGGDVAITGGVSSGDNPGGDITLVPGAAGPAKAGVQVVDVGNSRTGASPTGLANDATVYTAAIVVDGGSSQPIAVTGSAAQTYAALVSELDADTTGATWGVIFFDLQATSDTTGSSSSIAITDTDLFSSLSDFVAIDSAIAGTDVASSGAIVIPTQIAPDTTTNKLYNVAGALTWNGTDLTAGGGDVSKVGTPVDSQIGVWTGDGTIEGDPNFTWTGDKILARGPAPYLTLSDSNASGHSSANARVQFAWGGGDAVIGQIYMNSSDMNIQTTEGSIKMEPDTGGSEKFVDVTGSIYTSNDLRFDEQADHTSTPAAGFGYLWVRSDTPNALIFTDDAGTDHDITAGGGGGDVSKVGTPVDNQVGVWTGDGTLEGGTGLTFSGGILEVSSGFTFGSSNFDIVQESSSTASLQSANSGGAAWLFKDSGGTDCGYVWGDDAPAVGFKDAGASWTYQALNDGDHIWYTDGQSEIMRINRNALGDGTLELTGGLTFDERADHSQTPTAGIGELWVRSDTPNVPVFTDDAGTDHDLIPSTGTWTPVVSDGTNDCTMTNQSGTYTRIGNIVFITCFFTVNSIASASGPARITGLPFTAANVSAGHDYPLSLGQMASLATATDLVPLAQVEANTAYITLHLWQDGGAAATTTMSISQMSNGGEMRISGHYEV